MQQEVVIIGGGVGGLCAAIECCQKGIFPLVIEAGSYPSQKVCGEFLSPESLAFLHQCNIQSSMIYNAKFHIEGKQIEFIFPKPAGGLSHWILDSTLARHAISLGAMIYTQVKVESFIPKALDGDKHILELSNGIKIQADAVIISTGKFPFFNSPPIKHFQYMGIKAHYSGISMGQTLEMFGFQNAYIGLSPIEEGKTNIACLAKMSLVKKYSSISTFIEDLIGLNPRLKSLCTEGTLVFNEWMVAPVPFLGFKSPPDWKDTYFIGDAAMSIPPACGGGLSQSIASGRKVVHYILKRDSIAFRKACKKQSASVMRYAKFLHYTMMNPSFGKLVMSGCKGVPAIATWLFNATRQAENF